ncbi:MAG: DALR domain-containing protein, partial [Bacteroidota bacterium]
FHDMMRTFNTLSPSIEPRATGHIPEQIEMAQTIIDNGYAYVKNGSVYFNTIKFAQENDVYGKLSGRKIEDLLSETRELKNQGEKNHPSDFALWIKADETHLMRWNSPWSVGFPGWHLECSAMSTKYLGKHFDIHGGGNDLKFPHHENEIAQNVGAYKNPPAKYWMHTNMLLMNGRKMSKSDGNTITPQELFSGDNPHVSKGYSPMVIRFFMLQAHYRSTLDIQDEALQASEKGYRKLMETNTLLQALKHEGKYEPQADFIATVEGLLQQMDESMNDDFNTAKAIARMMELGSIVYKLHNKQLELKHLNEATLAKLQTQFNAYIYDVFGLKNELEEQGNGGEVLDGIMQLVIDLRKSSRSSKDWATADKIRDSLKELNVQLKDGKEGTTWSVNN